MAETKKYVKICPKCKSIEIRTNFKPNIGLGAPTEYVCDKCGFTSMIFPEIDVDELKKEEKKKKSVS